MVKYSVIKFHLELCATDTLLQEFPKQGSIETLEHRIYGSRPSLEFRSSGSEQKMLRPLTIFPKDIEHQMQKMAKAICHTDCVINLVFIILLKFLNN